MTPNLDQLSAQILDRASGLERFVVAIAGPPAAGKSTLAARLAEALRGVTRVAVIAQDGYHFDNEILQARSQLKVKGAPQTFDVDGFAQLLSRLKSQTEPLAVPCFDRELDLSRNCAAWVQPDDRIILVEGNYLLCDENPWSVVAQYLDFSIQLSVPLETLRERLVQRWIDHDHTPAQAIERASSNDLPNAEYVIARSSGADLIVSD